MVKKKISKEKEKNQKLNKPNKKQLKKFKENIKPYIMSFIISICVTSIILFGCSLKSKIEDKKSAIQCEAFEVIEHYEEATESEANYKRLTCNMQQAVNLIHDKSKYTKIRLDYYKRDREDCIAKEPYKTSVIFGNPASLRNSIYSITLSDEDNYYDLVLNIDDELVIRCINLGNFDNKYSAELYDVLQSDIPINRVEIRDNNTNDVLHTIDSKLTRDCDLYTQAMDYVKSNEYHYYSIPSRLNFEPMPEMEYSLVIFVE